MKRHPTPCRKFRNAGAVEFIRHVNETKCRECSAALDYLLDEVERVERERRQGNSSRQHSPSNSQNLVN
jgi:hypothetical protein